MNLTNCKFLNNTANKTGIILSESDSALRCNYCYFGNNYANETSTIFAYKNLNKLMIINNSMFLNNTSGSNLLNLIYSNAEINNTKFIDNVSKQVNNGITMIRSKVLSSNITIDYT